MIERFKTSLLSDSIYMIDIPSGSTVTKERKSLPKGVRYLMPFPPRRMLVECHDPKVIEQMLISYCDDIRRSTGPVIEHALEKISFRGGLSRRAKSLIIDEPNLSAAGIVKWLKESCSDEIVTIEGTYRTKAIFKSDKDLALAMIRFAK